jgi:hypothetical protein
VAGQPGGGGELVRVPVGQRGQPGGRAQGDQRAEHVVVGDPDGHLGARRGQVGQRQPVAAQQFGGLLRAEPALVVRFVHERPGVGGPDVGELRHAAAGSGPPGTVGRRAGQRAHRDLRAAVGRDPPGRVGRAGSRQHPDRFRLGQHHGHDRAAAGIGGGDRGGQVAGGPGGQHDGDDGVHSPGGGLPLQAGAEHRGGDRGGGVGDRADGQAELGAGVRGQGRGAADVGHDRDRAPGRGRLGGQQRGGLDQLAEAAGGDHAGLLEQRRPGPCFRALFPAGGKNGEHGHGRADPAGGPGELTRVAERLDVQHGQPGHAVLLPPQQHVVAGHVELVAHRRERGDPDAEPGQVVDRGEAQAAGLHDKPGHARRGRAGGERGVQADAGHGHPEAVRADQPHAVPAAGGEQAGLGGGVEPGGDDHQGPHAPLAALSGHLEHPRGGHRDHGQVHSLRQVRHGGQGPLVQLRGVRVHRVQAAGVAAGPDVVEDGPADRAGPPAGTDHRHRLGREHGPQAGRVGVALPAAHRVEVIVQRGPGVLARQREREVVDALGEAPPDRQARGGEHAQHGLVLGQGLGHERADPLAPGVGHQVLEQQGADAAVVHVVGHRERHLGLRGVLAQDDVAGHADHGAVCPGAANHGAADQGEQRRPARLGVAADAPRLGLGRQPAHVEEPQVGVVRGHGLVHGLDRLVVSRAGRPDLDRGPVGQQRVHRGGRHGHSVPP